MQYILICLFLYGILFVADIIPTIKKKEWKTLYVSLPIYAVTLVLNILIGIGIKIPSPNKAIESFLTSIFQIK